MKKRPRFESHEQLESARLMSKYVVRVLLANGFHGRVGLVLPDCVTIHLRPTGAKQFWDTLPKTFTHPPGRWRFYFPATDTHPPLVFRTSGVRAPSRGLPFVPFNVTRLEVSFVRPPFIL